MTNKGKWSIHLEKVVCPECGAEQPALRLAKNVKQLAFGGWTCEKCSCQMDKHGSRLEKKENTDSDTRQAEDKFKRLVSSHSPRFESWAMVE